MRARATQHTDQKIGKKFYINLVTRRIVIKKRNAVKFHISFRCVNFIVRKIPADNAFSVNGVRVSVLTRSVRRAMVIIPGN